LLLFRMEMLWFLLVGDNNSRASIVAVRIRPFHAWEPAFMEQWLAEG
jgi:hypothetical protein